MPIYIGDVKCSSLRRTCWHQRSLLYDSVLAPRRWLSMDTLFCCMCIPKLQSADLSGRSRCVHCYHALFISITATYGTPCRSSNCEMRSGIRPLNFDFPWQTISIVMVGEMIWIPACLGQDSHTCAESRGRSGSSCTWPTTTDLKSWKAWLHAFIVVSELLIDTATLTSDTHLKDPVRSTVKDADPVGGNVASDVNSIKGTQLFLIDTSKLLRYHRIMFPLPHWCWHSTVALSDISLYLLPTIDIIYSISY